MRASKSDKEAVTIRDLYPQLNDAELEQAEETFERYLALVQCIHERIRKDPKAHAELRTRLTTSTSGPYHGDWSL